MDKDTNDKLNDTLGKMGVMGTSQTQASGSGKPVKSSEKGFYIIMLAMIISMALYVSYDMEQRYGADKAASADAEPAQVNGLEPVIVNIEKTKSITVKPVAEIPATEQTPEAVVVEKVVNKTTVTTAVVPVPESPVATTKPAADSAMPQPVSGMMPVVTGVVNEMEKQFKGVVDASSDTAAKVVSAPVVAQPVAGAKDLETSAADSEAAATDTPAPAYDAYGYPYGGGSSYQQNYYPPQRPYRNPYYNQNRNPYGYGSGSGYGSGYGPRSGYGYGYNPYQQPQPQPQAAGPAE